MGSFLEFDDTFLETLQRLMQSTRRPTCLDEAVRPIQQMLDPGDSGRAAAIDWLGDEYLTDSKGMPRNLLEELNARIEDFQSKLTSDYLQQPIHVGLPREEPKVVDALATYSTEYALIIFVWTLKDPPVYMLIQKVLADAEGRRKLMETTLLPFLLYFTDALLALPEEFRIKNGVVRRATKQKFLTNKGLEVTAARRFNKDDQFYEYLFQGASKFEYADLLLPDNFVDLSNPDQVGTVFEIEATPECPAYDIEAFSDLTGSESEARVIFGLVSYWYIKDDVTRQTVRIKGRNCKPEIVQVRGTQGPVCEFCGFNIHRDKPHLHYAQCGCSKTPEVQEALKWAMDTDDLDTVLKLCAANFSQTDSLGTTLPVWAMMRDKKELIQQMSTAGAKFDPQAIAREVQKQKQREIGICEVHPENQFQAWCQTCKQPVCARCYAKRGVHSGHEIDTELRECFLEHEDDFSKSLQKIDAIVDELKCLKGKSPEDVERMCRAVERETANACAGIDELLAREAKVFQELIAKDEKEIAKLEARIQTFRFSVDKNARQLKASQDQGEDIKRKFIDRQRQHREDIDTWKQQVILKSSTGPDMVKIWREALLTAAAAKSPSDGSMDLACLEALRAHKDTKVFLSEVEKLQSLPIPTEIDANDYQLTLKKLQTRVDDAIRYKIKQDTQPEQGSVAFLMQQLKQVKEKGVPKVLSCTVGVQVDVRDIFPQMKPESRVTAPNISIGDLLPERDAIAEFKEAEAKSKTRATALGIPGGDVLPNMQLKEMEAKPKTKAPAPSTSLGDLIGKWKAKPKPKATPSSIYAVDVVGSLSSEGITKEAADEVRKNTRDVLLRAVDDGSLRTMLAAQMKSQAPSTSLGDLIGKWKAKPKANAVAPVSVVKMDKEAADEVRRSTKAVLLRAIDDGSLRTMLAAQMRSQGSASYQSAASAGREQSQGKSSPLRSPKVASAGSELSQRLSSLRQSLKAAAVAAAVLPHKAPQSVSTSEADDAREDAASEVWNAEKADDAEDDAGSEIWNAEKADEAEDDAASEVWNAEKADDAEDDAASEVWNAEKADDAEEDAASEIWDADKPGDAEEDAASEVYDPEKPDDAEEDASSSSSSEVFQG